MTLYTIIEVQDPAIKARLAVTCDDQPFIATAPLVLLFLADYQRWEDYFTACGVDEICAQKGIERRHPQEGDLFLAAAMPWWQPKPPWWPRMPLAWVRATSATLWRTTKLDRELFNLSRLRLPIALLCIGYPTEEQITRPQTRSF